MGVGVSEETPLQLTERPSPIIVTTSAMRVKSLDRKFFIFVAGWNRMHPARDARRRHANGRSRGAARLRFTRREPLHGARAARLTMWCARAKGVVP